LELYFNDSMHTVYVRGGGGASSQQREVADGADVVFTDTANWTANTDRYTQACCANKTNFSL